MVVLEMLNEYDRDVVKEALLDYCFKKQGQIEKDDYIDERYKNIDYSKLDKAFGMLKQVEIEEREMEKAYDGLQK